MSALNVFLELFQMLLIVIQKCINRISNTPIPPVKSVTCQIHPNRESPTILSLTDPIISLIISHLNQIEVISLITTHSRFRKLGQEKLFHSIYVRFQMKLKVSNKIHTSFYIKYTIINETETYNKLYNQGSLDLVRNLVFCWDEAPNVTRYRDLMFLYPQMTITIEHPLNYQQLNFLQTKQVGCLRRFTLDNPLTFREYNIEYMEHVQDLNIHYSSFKNLIQMISKLPNPRILRVRHVLEETFKLFKSNKFNKVEVEKLIIVWREEINPEYIKSLKYMFNLSKLTVLELHLCSHKKPPPEYESDLQQLLSETSNLTQFSLVSQHMNFVKLINTLKPNTLTSLGIKLVPPFKGTQLHYECEMQEILKTQLQSISRINFTKDSNIHHYCQDGFDEFERIFKAPSENYNLTTKFDLAVIRQLLQSDVSN